MPLIEDQYSDTVGRIRFPITSSMDYLGISSFYGITGALPHKIEEPHGYDCVIHLVRLRNLPSMIVMGLTTAPTYTTQFQTDSFEEGITRMIILDSDGRCVVRYEKDSSGWSTFGIDKPRLKYFTD